ncbi:helix-turn-helix domain-containing protein [Megamonas rupellensis]|uniref:helix-turn-helix domain-containing protein n=1 Tax=Megamonas rupellensis TaxID=491921 RepID=UPI00311A0EFD
MLSISVPSVFKTPSRKEFSTNFLASTGFNFSNEIIIYYDNSNLITIDELYEILIIGKNTAYSLLKSEAIKSFKINHIWKIPRVSIDEYIMKQVKK